MVSFGKNVQGEVKGDKLFLEIDLTKEFGLSNSGKTTIVATTGPAAEVATGVKLGLNVYRK